jgi:hypothetical protein
MRVTGEMGGMGAMGGKWGAILEWWRDCHCTLFPQLNIHPLYPTSVIRVSADPFCGRLFLPMLFAVDCLAMIDLNRIPGSSDLVLANPKRC